jgi:hypothetical protein
MGLWDALRGRRTTSPPNLDALFLVPSASVTLQTSIGLTPTGGGSVCFRSAAGAAFQQTQAEVVALIEADPETPEVEVTTDSFGFTWLSIARDPDEVAGLCTDLHAVNTALETQGFGDGLLCSLVPFQVPGGARVGLVYPQGFGDGLLCSLVPFQVPGGARVGLVYLYKRGTFYPFAPKGSQERDNLLELQVRDALADELPVEQDLSRWLAIWGAPGL